MPILKKLERLLNKAKESPSNEIYGDIMVWSRAGLVLPYGKYVYTIGEYPSDLSIQSEPDKSWAGVAAECLMRSMEKDRRQKAKDLHGMKKGKEIWCETEFVNDCLFSEGEMPILDVLYFIHLDHGNLDGVELRPIEVEINSEGVLCPSAGSGREYYPLAAKFVPRILDSCVENGYVIDNLYIGNTNFRKIKLTTPKGKPKLMCEAGNLEIPKNIIKEIKAFNARSK